MSVLTMTKTRTFPSPLHAFRLPSTAPPPFLPLQQQQQEDILVDSPDRFSLFPIRYPDIYDEYRKSLACFWTADEIDLQQDKIDYRQKLNDNEKHFVNHILGFFASADGIVIENLVTSFCNDVKAPEAKAFYAIQSAIETIHAESYALMIETLVDEKKEKEKLFNAIEQMPCVKKKASWALEWIKSSRPFAERLVAFAVVEGIFFSGAFCSIFWLKKRGLMPGLAFANELISRDEGLHTDFACLLFRNHIKNKPTRKRVLEIIAPAVEMEVEFVRDALPVSLIGMNANTMSEYVKFVADHLLVSLGFEKHYNTSNPFDFMQMISLEGKTNFFEKRVADYQKAGVMSSKEENSFATDSEF